MTPCDTCVRIDCSTCNIPNEDRNPGCRRKSVQIKDLHDVTIYDACGKPIGTIYQISSGSTPKPKEPEEEPDWRNDYWKHKEKTNE